MWVFERAIFCMQWRCLSVFWRVLYLHGFEVLISVECAGPARSCVALDCQLVPLRD